jgi:TRAP-type C4-dicarboxylate transport system substrate-binding protein
MSPEVLVMSRKAWDSLSAEDQTIFREAARDSSLYMRRRWQTLEDASRRAAEAAGTTIVTDFDRKAFETAMDDIYQQTMRDPEAGRLIERIRQTQ